MINRQITAWRFEIANKLRTNVPFARAKQSTPTAIRAIHPVEFTLLAGSDPELPYDNELRLPRLALDRHGLSLNAFLDFRVSTADVSCIQRFRRHNLTRLDLLNPEPRDSICPWRRDQNNLEIFLPCEFRDFPIRGGDYAANGAGNKFGYSPELMGNQSRARVADFVLAAIDFTAPCIQGGDHPPFAFRSAGNYL